MAWPTVGWVNGKAKRNVRHLCYHHSSWLKAAKFWWLTATQRYCNGHCIWRRGKPRETSKQQLKATDIAKLTEQHQTTPIPFSFPIACPVTSGAQIDAADFSELFHQVPQLLKAHDQRNRRQMDHHLSCDHTNFKQTNHLWRSNMTGRTQFKQDDDWGC